MTAEAESLEEFGRYRLLCRIGQGGMAEVYKAKSFGVEGFEKVLVIKRILPSLARSQSFVDMFVHEAKLAVRLSHANIVQVFDLGRVEAALGPSYFMAMEFVDGLDLATVIHRSKWQGLTIPIGMAVYIAAEVAKGLDHAHRRRDEQNRPLGIVHRDISPQNVLLSWEGEVKVTDFGIAKARDSIENEESPNSRELKGKYSYMSPEQARGDSVDARSDLFSLGVVLYELLTGGNPFRGPTSFETLRRVQACEYPPLEVVRPDAPGPLVELVRRVMSKEPPGRFADAARLYEELLAYLYSSGTRFGASDLSDFLAKFRDPTSGELLAAAPVQDSQDERTPVQLPASVSRLRIGEKSDSVQPASGQYQRRDATALVVSFRPRKGAIAPEVRKQVRETLARFGGQPVEDDAAVQVAAVFGLGEADGRDAEYAVRAALLVMRLLAETPVPIAIGIHSGRLLVASAGLAERDELLTALLGTAQELARTGDQRIVISTAAARHVRELVSLDPLEPGLHKLTSSQGYLVGALRTMQDAVGAFIGRRDELGILGRQIGDAADKRQLHVVGLLGPPGSGKTRLIHELDRQRRNSPRKLSLYVATCLPRGADVPLSGITAMLFAICGVQEGAPAETTRAVEPDLRSLGLVDVEVAAVMAQMGAPVDDKVSAGAHLRPALVRMLSSLSARNVQVLVWDDAHCLDTASQKLLIEVGRRIRATRTVLVLSAREPSDVAWVGDHIPIDLRDLSAHEQERLIAARLGVRTVPKELVDFCTQRAGEHAGSPLFLEELVNELRDAGSIAVRDGLLQHLDLRAEQAVPRSLRSLVATRLSRLDPDVLRILGAAAVLGEPIDPSCLAIMAAHTGAEIDRALAILEERVCLRRNAQGTYSFATPLLRDVLLETLPPDTQRDWHGRAALALDEVLGQRADEQAHRIASQWLDANQKDKAAQYFHRSAQRLLSTRQYEAATIDALRALELLDLDAAKVSDLLAHSKVLSSAVSRTRMMPPSSQAILKRMVDRADAAGASDERAAIRIDAARTLGAIAMIDPALELLAPVHETSVNAPHLGQQARLVEADLYFRKGDFPRCRQVLDDAQTRGLATEQSERVTMTLAQVYAALGDNDQALAHVNKALANPTDDPIVLHDRAKGISLVYAFMRDLVRATEYMQEAVERSRAANLPLESAVNLHNLGDVAIRRGDYSRAYAALAQSLELCEQNSADRLASNNRVYLAFLDSLQGAQDAEQRIREGIEFAVQNGYTWDVLDGRYFLGRLLARQGRYAEAISELETTRDKAHEVQFKLLEDDAKSALAEIQTQTPQSDTGAA